MSAKFINSSWHNRLALAADGALITAGLYCLGMGAALVLHNLGVAPLDDSALSLTGAPALLAVISWLLQVGGLVVGPFLVWKLRDRLFSGPAFLGMLLGFPVTAAVVMAVGAVTMGLDWLLSRVVDFEYLGPIILLVLLSGAMIAITIWLVLDAIHDLSDKPKRHVALDIVRFIAALGVLGAAALLVYSFSTTGDIEGVDFLLAGAAMGAVVVTTAEYTQRFFEHRQTTSTSSHA